MMFYNSFSLSFVLFLIQLPFVYAAKIAHFTKLENKTLEKSGLLIVPCHFVNILALAKDLMLRAAKLIKK